MIFAREGNTTTILQENITLREFVKNLKRAYPKLKKDHLIINLFSFAQLGTGELLEFLDLSNQHRGANKSFVLVTNKVNYDDIPDEICVVPTLQEARDIIEMEDIERDLGL